MICNLTNISRAAEPYNLETARDDLWDIAVALAEDKYLVVAAAISRYLITGCTLDQAFGVSELPKRGAPKLKRDEQMHKVFELRLQKPKPMPWKLIANEIEWQGTIDNLRKAYLAARDQVMTEELCRRLSCN